MNSENTITEFYRQIGTAFREHGADRVVLLKAKNCQRRADVKEQTAAEVQKTNGELETEKTTDFKTGAELLRPSMYLEIAADGCFDRQELQKLCAEQWPDTEISILDLDTEENLNLIDEVLEDGILL